MHMPEPISPILKEIIIPHQSVVMPGADVIIRGKGFSKNDLLFLENDGGIFQVEVKEVTDDFIRFVLPLEAGGSYRVVVERAGKTTVLESLLVVPFVVPVTEVELPSSNLTRESSVIIIGKGFEQGDILEFSAGFYPDGKVYEVTGTADSDGFQFIVPATLYGINQVAVVRGDRRTNLGTITVETNVGDVLGGGIVYWVDANKAHGYIAAKVNVGTSQEQWGPERDVSDATGTSKALGSGQVNTQKAVAKMIAMRTQHGWPEWANVKIAAELCDEFTFTENGLTYSDWFLPSHDELIELFKVKAMMATKGGMIGGNNFWTSSEGDGNTAGWSAYYVNFYEDTNVVLGNVSKAGWKIGVRPVRAY